MKVLGLDPGLSGAYALLRDGDIVCSADLPRIGDGAQSRIQGSLFAAVIRDLKPDVAVIEEVASRPGEGGASIFKFGRAVGALEGILAACDVPLHRVTPSRWKGHFRLPGKAKGGEEASRQRAMELWPTHVALFSRKMDHHRADAALIGRWFFETAFKQQRSAA